MSPRPRTVRAPSPVRHVSDVVLLHLDPGRPARVCQLLDDLAFLDDLVVLHLDDLVLYIHHLILTADAALVLTILTIVFIHGSYRAVT